MSLIQRQWGRGEGRFPVVYPVVFWISPPSPLAVLR